MNDRSSGLHDQSSKSAERLPKAGGALSSRSACVCPNRLESGRELNPLGRDRAGTIWEARRARCRVLALDWATQPGNRMGGEATGLDCSAQGGGGETAAALAREFEVGQATVWRALNSSQAWGKVI